MKDDEKKAIIVRYFRNEKIDIRMENAVFSILGERGLGPKDKVTTKEHRVEECIMGKPVTFIELRNVHFGKAIARALCQMNYD